MNFELTTAQKDAQKLAREFTEKQLLPGILERDSSSTFPVEAHKKFGELGFIGLPYPKEVGGQGGDYLSYILAVEETSKVDASFGIAYSVCTSLYSGSVMATNIPVDTKKKFMEKVLSGKSFGSFALTEPTAGSDVAGALTQAVQDGDSYVINGSKCFITNAPLSDYFVVYAFIDPASKAKTMACFVVEKGTPGFSIGKIEDKMGIRSAQVAELAFQDVRVPAANMIAEPGKGFGLAMKTLDGGRIGVAAQGLGIAKGAFEVARKYMMERQQFGKPLFANQYLGFKMAELQTYIDMAELMLYKAAMDKEEGRPFSVSAAKAKLCCTDVAMEVTTQCVQMMGGNGYMKEYHVERMMRDAKITQIYEGTNEIQKLIISGGLFK